MLYFFFFFFFQAEDGIRDHCVTGVQTCALPISCPAPLPGRIVCCSAAESQGRSWKVLPQRHMAALAGADRQAAPNASTAIVFLFIPAPRVVRPLSRAQPPGSSSPSAKGRVAIPTSVESVTSPATYPPL